MDFREIPTIGDDFELRMAMLRGQISSAIEEIGAQAPVQTVESTLNNILPDSVLKYFEDWFEQRPYLEMCLIETFLDTIVRNVMEPEINPEHRYQYSLHSEGWCLHPSHKRQPHFIRGESVAHGELYTLGKLIDNWRAIFICDEDMDKNPALLDAYAPRHKHEDVQIPGVLVTTRHELKIVNSRGRYVNGTTISYARAKAGLRHLFKIAEWLTGIRAEGTPRDSIDDYLAALSRVPDKDKTWVKAMQVIQYTAQKTPGDLGNILRLQRYSFREAEDLRKKLEEDLNVGGFVSGRSDLEFLVEKPARGRRYDRKFGEILIPYCKNIIGYQIYNDEDFTRSEGVEEQRHDRYRWRREQEIREGFTPWHWSIIRRFAPYFVDRYICDTFKKIYEPYLSLDHFRSKGSKPK